MRIGIRDGCLQMPWPEAFEAAGEIGFDGVELDIGQDYAATVLWAKDGVARVQEMAEEGGCEVLALCAGVCWGLSPASPEASAREEIRRVLTDLTGFAAGLGADVILVPVTPGGDGVEYEEGRDRWVEEMRAMAPVVEECGVVLALENVGNGYGKSAGELACLVDAVGSAYVQVYYDVGNATAFGNDPVEEIRELGSRIAAVHIKDRDGELLGEGVVRIAESIAALWRIGYQGDLVLETPATKDARAAAAHNLEYLQGLL